MKGSIFTVLAVFVLSAVSAIEIAPQSSQPKVLALDFQRRSVSNASRNDTGRWQKRHNPIVPHRLEYEDHFFTINIPLGTPPQTMELILDTSFGDLWVYTTKTKRCLPPYICLGGTFNTKKSSTFSHIKGKYEAHFLSGGYFAGRFGTDVLSFGGAKIENFGFALAEAGSPPHGVLGIGPASNESPILSGAGPTYANFLSRLVDQGLINGQFYSLWLNSSVYFLGHVLFGGIDRAKFTGELQTVPLHSYRGVPDSCVNLNGVTINDTSISSSTPLGCAILDYSLSSTYLPDDMVKRIYKVVGAGTIGTWLDRVFVPCDSRHRSLDFTFALGDVVIRIPFIDFVDPHFKTEIAGGEKVCQFTILPQSSHPRKATVFGSSFLNGAYVVYDFDRHEVSIARSVHTAATDIQELPRRL